jgi:hypothetical protein
MHLPRFQEVWLPPYVRSRWDRWLVTTTCRHVWVTMADHFEPFWANASAELADERVAMWRRIYPQIAAQYADSTGLWPVYTFFYAEEHYRPELIDSLAEMVAPGIADVEVHLHHDGEGERDFTDRISGFTEKLFTRHGLLRKERDSIRFGFIHGDWALDNSLPHGKACGLNNEITVLRDMGCYADFTMPSGPSPSQSRMVNTIYWATDDPHRPKSYDTGRPLEPHGPTGDLLMIGGPLGLRWRERLLPRLEMGEISGHDRPTAYRVTRWLEMAPRLGEHIFVKLFAHGAQERNAHLLLGGGLAELFGFFNTVCRRRGLQLHYVSAWQMYQAIIAIWKGLEPVAADARGNAAIPAGQTNDRR